MRRSKRPSQRRHGRKARQHRNVLKLATSLRDTALAIRFAAEGMAEFTRQVRRAQSEIVRLFGVPAHLLERSEP